MTTTTKATRTCKVVYGNQLVMTFVGPDGKASADAYDIREVSSPCGRGFRLTKTMTAGTGLDARTVRGETYETHVAGDGSQHCTCPAGKYRGLCRHASALRRLIEAGKIEGGFPASGKDEDSTDA